MSKRAYIYLPIFAVITGVCGAVIRAVELYRAFDTDTGLMAPGDMSVQVMRVFTVAVIIISAVLSALLKGRLADDLHLLSGEDNTVSKIISTAGCLMLIAAAAYDYMAGRSTLRVSEIVLLLLAVFSAISLIVRMIKPGKDYAFFSIVPVFWCSFWLILIYRDRSIDPVVEYYIYELFAVVTGMIFFYRLAGYEFGSRKPRLSVFFGIIAVYLGFVTALGSVIARVVFNLPIDHARGLLYYAASATVALGGLCWITKCVSRNQRPDRSAS
jgi:hypothetical protein